MNKRILAFIVLGFALVVSACGNKKKSRGNSNPYGYSPYNYYQNPYAGNSNNSCAAQGYVLNQSGQWVDRNGNLGNCQFDQNYWLNYQGNWGNNMANCYGYGSNSWSWSGSSNYGCASAYYRMAAYYARIYGNLNYFPYYYSNGYMATCSVKEPGCWSPTGGTVGIYLGAGGLGIYKNGECTWGFGWMCPKRDDDDIDEIE